MRFRYHGNHLYPSSHLQSLYRHDPRFWSRRPLTKQMMVYAAADVVILEKLYEKLSPQIASSPPETLSHFHELVQEQILTCIHPDEIRQRRKMRKNEKDLEELKSKIETAYAAGEVGVLSNRELRLLKSVRGIISKVNFHANFNKFPSSRHLTLPDAIKNSLKSSLKIAKKLEKLEKRDSEGGPGSTSSSELTSLEPCPDGVNGNGRDSSQGLGDYYYPQTNFVKVEELLTGLSALVGEREEGNESERRREAATQTSSTGDIVLMRVWEEEADAS